MLKRLLLLLLLTACTPAPTPTPTATLAPSLTPSPTVILIPSETPTPSVVPARTRVHLYDCTEVPQVTPERSYPLLLTQTPPPQARAGTTFIVTYAGGRIFFARDYNCAEAYVRIEPNVPFGGGRSVSVQLDERQILSTSCNYKCTLSILIPRDVAPGLYALRFDDLSYDLEIVP